MPEGQKGLHNPHDSGFKYLLSSKKAFVQLLRSFVKAPWAEQVEEASLVRLDKSFVLQDFQNKEADLIYRARLKDSEVIFYLLLELQSTVDYLIPYRLLLYMTELWRDSFKNASPKDTRRKHFRLPVIVPLVLYNSPGEWTAPLSFKETLHGSALFGEQLLDFRYLLINVCAYQEEELLALSNLLGAVFFMDQAADLTGITTRLKKLSGILKQLEPDELNIFAAWAGQILSRNLPQAEKENIAASLQKLGPEEVEGMISNVERVIKKSLAEAMEKGMEKGMEKVVRQMLAEGEELEKIIRYTGLSREAIEELR